MVEDPSLATEGAVRIAWARANTPLLARLREEFEQERPLAGRRVGMCLHVESKTAVLVETLRAGGAEVVWTGSPATTDDGVAAALAQDPAIVVDDGSETRTPITRSTSSRCSRAIPTCCSTTAPT